MKQAKPLGIVEIAGWRAMHMSLPTGAAYYSIVTGSRSRKDIGYAAVWIRGRVEGRNLTTGLPLATRTPWLVSTDLPPLSVGRLEFAALEDSEWLCFDAKLNGGLVPELAIVANSSPPPDAELHPLAEGVSLAIKRRA